MDTTPPARPALLRWGMRSLAPVAVVLIASCSPSSRPATRPAPAPVETVEPRPEPTPHADYAALRPFRNYYRIVRVGAYRQHYLAYYVHNEQVRASYVAAPDGTGLEYRGHS